MKEKEILEKPSLLAAIIMPFVGYPVVMALAFLLMLPTFLMSAGLFIYLTPLRTTILFFPLGFMGWTLPYILFYLKGDNPYNVRCWGVTCVILVYILLFLNGYLMPYATPELCSQIWHSNITTGGEFICKQ